MIIDIHVEEYDVTSGRFYLSGEVVYENDKLKFTVLRKTHGENYEVRISTRNIISCFCLSKETMIYDYKTRKMILSLKDKFEDVFTRYERSDKTRQSSGHRNSQRVWPR